MHPVLLLTHNNLDLTKRCVESIRSQDLKTTIEIIDNGSTDGTPEWLSEQGINNSKLGSNYGVSVGWNQGLRYFFELPHHEDHVLVVNNDTILPPWFYRELLARHVEFVTGVSVGSMEQIAAPPALCPLVPSPDFSAFLMRREAWQRVGLFDERMKLYASDNDWHVRAHRAGVPLWNAGVPFYHQRSSTLNRAPHGQRRQIQLQADADREVFRQIYGVYPWEPGYADLFAPLAQP